MTAPARAGSNGSKQDGLYDLSRACEAAIAEATGRPFRFSYKGELYEIPNQKLWPLQAQADVAQSNDLAAFFTAIGAEDGRRLLAAGLNTAEFEQLMEWLSEESGVSTVPNSSPPRQRGSTRT